MTRSLPLFLGSAAALLLAGCGSTNPPLMFGDTTTFGLRLGNDGATSGGSVSIGYKAQSVAIVPVTYLDGNGKSRYLSGYSGADKRDALSVFASFESATPKTDAESNSIVRLGQVFSTGLAAQQVTLGYLCREMPKSEDCVASKLVALHELADAAEAERKKKSPDKEKTTAGAGSKAADDGPYQAPLFFARNDVIGIDIGGSLAQQGLQFALGYSNRNLALIPTTTKASDGRIRPIMGKHTDEDDEPSLDVLSVIGQFKANTKTTGLGFGFERFFATGVAARHLGTSLSAAIAKIPPPAASPALPTAAASASAVASSAK